MAIKLNPSTTAYDIEREKRIDRSAPMPTAANSNLLFVEEMAELAVANGRSVHVTRNLAGFEVDDGAAADEAWDEARAGYRKDADVLRRKLGKVEVAPLAVLPASWWGGMVAEAGLYDLSPRQDGTVGITPAEEADRAMDPLVLLACSLVPPALATPVFALATGGATGAPGAVLAFVLSWAACTFLFMLLHTGRATNPFDRAVAWIAAKVHLARTGGEVAFMRRVLAHGDGPVSLAVTLPVPPADVAATLARIDGMKGVRVAVMPGAVAFSRTPTEIVIRSMMNRWTEEAERRKAIREERRARMAALDPIVYVRHGAAVAIVAQFGDCPIERELCHRVMAKFSTI